MLTGAHVVPLPIVASTPLLKIIYIQPRLLRSLSDPSVEGQHMSRRPRERFRGRAETSGSTLLFTGAHLDSQDFGSDDDHMVPRVFLA